MPAFVRRFLIPVTLVALSLPGLAGEASAAHGDLDPTFDGDGIVVNTSIGQTFGMALQPDGKIVVAGRQFTESDHDFFVARYTTAGALDPSFGGGGTVTTPVGSDDDEAQAIALQPDGKIVVVGHVLSGSKEVFGVVRYTTFGALDATFSGDGKLTLGFLGSDNDFANAVAIQDDGKIVVAGYSDFGDDEFALLRLDATGGLDTSFDGDGKVTTDVSGGSQDNAYAVAIQEDGKILVGGFRSGPAGLARYTTGGVLDPTFGIGGTVATALGDGTGTSRIDALAIQPDGKILAAGTGGNSGSAGDFGLARYASTGALDTTFDGDGKVTTVIGSFNDNVFAVALQDDGKIVAAGRSGASGSGDFALARYSTSGALDPTFGSGGTVLTPISSGDDRAVGVAIQPDGKIVAGGQAGFGVALARYIGSPAITVSDVSITEGDSGTEAVTFVISLSAKYGAPISVDFYTRDGTAKAGTDYEARQGTRVFFAGQRTKQVTVHVIGDSSQEGDETFSLRLADSQSGYILDGEAVATIADNDLPKASVTDVTATETNSGTTKTFAFKINLDKAGTNSITISYATADGTAVAPGDYTAKSGSVTFSPGQLSKTVSVVVKGDNTVEPNETFFLNISTTSAFVVIADSQGVGTINNND